MNYAMKLLIGQQQGQSIESYIEEIEDLLRRAALAYYDAKSENLLSDET